MFFPQAWILEYQGGNWVTIDNNNGYLNHDCPPFVFHIPLYPNFFVYISPLNPIKSHYNPYYQIKSHIYICIFIHTYIPYIFRNYPTYVYAYIYMYICISVYLYICLYAYVCKYTYINICIMKIYEVWESSLSLYLYNIMIHNVLSYDIQIFTIHFPYFSQLPWRIPCEAHSLQQHQRQTASPSTWPYGPPLMWNNDFVIFYGHRWLGWFGCVPQWLRKPLFTNCNHIMLY